MLLTREQARDLDRRAIDEFGVPGIVLMENAGRGMAELLLPLGIHGPVVILCGKGNNGGDGFVIARHLDNAGVRVRVLLFADPAELRGDAAVNHAILVKSGAPIEVRTDADEAQVRADLEADWVIDALFGSGLQGPVRPPFNWIISAINASSARVFAVDIPSGLDCDTGQPMGPTVRGASHGHRGGAETRLRGAGRPRMDRAGSPHRHGRPAPAVRGRRRLTLPIAAGPLRRTPRIVTIDWPGETNARGPAAVTLPDVDPICVVIGRTRHGMMLAEIQEAAKQGAGLIELRLDFLKKAPDFKRLLANKPCPLIATVRRPVDGGKWDGSEDARQTLLRHAIVAGFDWVDLETDIADSIRRFGDVRRIVSYHNFREMPADLEKIHQRRVRQDADVVKVVVIAQQPADNLRVLSLIRKAPKPTVAFCMGDVGFPSRILQAKFGTPFTYAAFNKERLIALGMPSFAEVKQVYHYDKVNADTEVFGVIGDPVGHSLSPLIHNLAFRKIGLNAVYLPFRVPRETLADFLQHLRPGSREGLQRHHPAQGSRRRDRPHERRNRRAHQGGQHAGARHRGFRRLQHRLSAACSRCSRSSCRSSASNPPNQYRGLARRLPPPPRRRLAEPAFNRHGGRGRTGSPGARGRRRGPGGGACACTAEGPPVTLANRTTERSKALAAEVGCRFVEWNARHSVLCDLVINCTSVGMHPNVDETPLHHGILPARDWSSSTPSTLPSRRC